MISPEVGSAPGRAEGAAPGKVILFGEHAVVHGEPAIAAAIDREVVVRIEAAGPGERLLETAPGEPAPGPEDRHDGAPAPADPRIGAALRLAAESVKLDPSVGFRATVRGDVPIGAGLGSSAALAVALCRALSAWSGTPLSAMRLMGAVQQIETVFHGTPSGVDGTTSATGGVLWFRRGSIPQLRPLGLPAPLELVVALSGEARTTAALVLGLRERVTSRPGLYRPVFRAIGEIVRAAEPALLRGEHGTLGEAFTVNHGLLRTCGVSTEGLDALVSRAMAAGALGAKLTGAGGGGAILALPGEGDALRLCAALARHARDAFVVRIGEAGQPGRAQAPAGESERDAEEVV